MLCVVVHYTCTVSFCRFVPYSSEFLSRSREAVSSISTLSVSPESGSIITSAENINVNTGSSRDQRTLEEVGEMEQKLIVIQVMRWLVSHYLFTYCEPPKLLRSYEADSHRAADKDCHYATLCQHVTNIGTC